jgi:phosphoglycerate dehydrogenase-like enzyme
MKIWIESSALKPEHIDQLKLKYRDIIFEQDIDHANDAEVIIAMPPHVKPEILSRFHQLKWIQLLTAGFNTVNLDDIKSRGIHLTYAKDVFSIQIAEDVFSKILYFNRNLHTFHEQQKSGLWKFKTAHHELFGSTIGIIGTGSIGTEVAKRMKAFGVRVIGFKRSSAVLPFFDQIYYGKEGLMDVMRQSDVVVISCALSKETYHLIGKKELEAMKPTALIINVARGEIIDQDQLIERLENKKIRGAGLDVTTPEPLPSSSKLWTLDNVLITPHNASSSPHVHIRLFQEVDEAIFRYINHLPFDNLVNP